MPKLKQYLIARLAKFPGLEIPLLTDEEYKARGLKKPKFPPFESLTSEQKAAAIELRSILTRVAVQQACRCILRHLELMQADSYTPPDTDPDIDIEREATRRALDEIRSGKWKPTPDDIAGLEKAMIWTLDAILRVHEQEGVTLRRKRSRAKRVH